MDFEIGTSVKITSVPDKYQKFLAQLQNASGTIEDIYLGPDRLYPYAIMVEGVINPASSNGWFWLNETNFNEEKENDNMNKFLTNKDYKFATVVRTASDGEPYDVCAYQGELKEGDIVVCDFGYKKGALSVRIVVTTDVPRDIVNNVDGEILGVADVSAYRARKEKEEKRNELKKKMTEQAKRYQEESFWRMIAETDPEMKKLYDEFTELSK